MTLSPPQPVDVRPLLLPLHEELMALLRGLPASDWARPATARWTVRDVAAHLLDTDVRRLSFHRDRHPVPPPDRAIDGYDALAAVLHGLNAEWIAAARRLSPAVLVDLLAVAGEQSARFLSSLDPQAVALWPVAWAGESESRNWMDVGREYTERWHHQQQVREAVGAPLLVEPRWLRPALDVAAHALPRAWAATRAPVGTAVQVRVEGPSGGAWVLHVFPAGWTLLEGEDGAAAATIITDEDTAWRLWHKALAPEEARSRVRVVGDAALAEPFFEALALMA
ncbi:MAG TPA: maleylpyruvate isomerase N-terminal domain-containing protein [Vicinamibacteria bacterium]|nr:maleylpyruvate isomerase N-terminal domain-containing protein [Vicinamibacteria bacterium]